MTQAGKYRKRMIEQFSHGEHVKHVNIVAGIVTLTFDDDSKVDFTHPEVLPQKTG